MGRTWWSDLPAVLVWTPEEDSAGGEDDVTNVSILSSAAVAPCNVEEQKWEQKPFGGGSMWSLCEPKNLWKGLCSSQRRTGLTHIFSSSSGLSSCSGEERSSRSAQPGGWLLQQQGHQAQSAQPVPVFQAVWPLNSAEPPPLDWNKCLPSSVLH